MDDYEILSQVGEGSFGHVYKAIRRTTGEIVAFKIIRKCGRSIEELKSLQRECKIQRYLYHPNIIRMLDSFETENEMFVITEYANKQLYEMLAKAGRFSEERVQVIACDLVSALYYLHSNRILHRDLKPQNVLLDENGVCKLCDFGFARIMSAESDVFTSIKGTPLYMAPELIEEYPYDHNVDLWSLGCIIYELLTGVPPFSTSSIVQLIKLIRHETIKWPNFISLNCKSFLQGLLQKDPMQRLTWPNLLLHSFVKERILIIEGNVPSFINNSSSVNQIGTDQANKTQREDYNKISTENHKLLNSQKKFNKLHCSSITQNDCTDCSEINYENFTQNMVRDVTLPSNVSIFDNYNPYNFPYNGFDKNENSIQKMNSFITQSNNHTALPKNVKLNISNEKINKEGNDNAHKSKGSESWDSSNTSQTIINEEWLAFLERSMEEIMDGEIESLLQENCVTVFVSPLRNPTASYQVIEYISSLLSLPFVLSIKKEDLKNIQGIYFQAKVIPNIIYAIRMLMADCKEKELSSSESSKVSESTFILPAEKLKALESSMVLLCRLLYTDEKFVQQFCNTIYITNETQLFYKLLNLENRKSRIVADFIAILIKLLQIPVDNTNVVDKILSECQPIGLIELFSKLLSYRESILRSRTCILIRLLGKCKRATLQQIWGKYMRNLLENLTNDDDVAVRNAAEETITELQRLSYFNQEIQAG